jgi:hypothetical protein
VLPGVQHDLLGPVSKREREGTRLHELRSIADDGKDPHAGGERYKPMTKHLTQAGFGVLAFGYRTSRNLGWYLNRRLARTA